MENNILGVLISSVHVARDNRGVASFTGLEHSARRAEFWSGRRSLQLFSTAPVPVPVPVDPARCTVQLIVLLLSFLHFFPKYGQFPQQLPKPVVMVTVNLI